MTWSLEVWLKVNPGSEQSFPSLVMTKVMPLEVKLLRWLVFIREIHAMGHDFLLSTFFDSLVAAILSNSQDFNDTCSIWNSFFWFFFALLFAFFFTLFLRLETWSFNNLSSFFWLEDCLLRSCQNCSSFWLFWKLVQFEDIVVDDFLGLLWSSVELDLEYWVRDTLTNAEYVKVIL